MICLSLVLLKMLTSPGSLSKINVLEHVIMVLLICLSSSVTKLNEEMINMNCTESVIFGCFQCLL